MARVTVEDCIDKVANRFDLILLAAQRAHDIHAGAVPMVPRGNDKPPVLALREIGAGTLELNGIAARTAARLRRVDIGSGPLNPREDEPDDDAPAFDRLTEEELLARLSEDDGSVALAVAEDDADDE